MAYLPTTIPQSVFGSVFTYPQANQSVSGAVNIGVGTQVIGSVAALQGTNPWVTTMGGSVAAVIIGGSVATATTNSSVMLLNGAGVIGSVTALQGTNPWIETFSNSSIIAYQLAGSVLATSATVNAGNSSVQLLNSPNVIGSVATLQGTNPWIVNTNGSVAAVIIGGSIATATTNSSVMLLNSANVIGSVATLQGTNPWQVAIVSGSVATATTNSSVMLLNGANVIGSVTTLQGTNPWNISSVYGNISGSVVSFQGTNPWVIGSIVGTYSEDVQSTAADKGLFTLGIRNDTMASLVGTDLDYTGWATDSAGRHLVKPFVSEDGTIISFITSVVSGSVTLIQASAIGKRNYITDFWVSNTGTATTLITFLDGSTSVVGYTIAPANGGSNSPGIAIPLRTAPSQDLAFKVASPTSILYMTVKGYQSP